MPLTIQFKTKEAALLNKLSIRVKDDRAEYRYIPFFFRKVSEHSYEILTAAQVPAWVMESLKDMTTKHSQEQNELHDKPKFITPNRGK